MNKFVIVAGSNVENSQEIITDVINKISSQYSLQNKSSIYKSPDFFGSGTVYHNVVLKLISKKSQDQLIEEFKLLETKFGRSPKSKFEGKVPLDIDIVIFNHIILRPKDFDARYFQEGYNQILE